MAQFPLFTMIDQTQEQEEKLAQMLADLAEASGVPIEDIMASEFEEAAPEEAEFRVGEIGERELEEAAERFEMENKYSKDSGAYLDQLLEDNEVNPKDEPDSPPLEI